MALTLIAYLPALQCGFIWDDDSHVTQNLTLRSLHGLWRIWFEMGAVPQYYPLVHTMFWVEYHLWQLNPLGYHLVNVLLHGLGSILLWRVLMKLQVPGAWLAAAIWALHPVQVESVAWITERKNVLSTVFYFAAALTYLRFAQKSEVRSQKPEGGGRKAGSQSLTSGLRPLTSGLYWLSLFFFTCALLSKTVACSLPAALLLVCWWKKGRIGWRDVWPLLPFFVLGAGLGLLTAHVEKTHVGAQGAEWVLTFGQRCLIAGRALWFYAGKLIWPSNLTFIYPRWEVSAAMGWQWSFPIAVLVVIAVLWFLRNRIGRGPLVAVLFFSGTLFPALGFINVYPMRYSFVADHFQYLAEVGLFTLFVSLLYRLPGLFRRLCVVVLLAVLCKLTWSQAHVYRDLETLWQTTTIRNPACWMAHYNLGILEAGEGRYSDAIEQFHLALQFKPDYREAYNNLGNTYAVIGQLDEAIENYHEAIRLDPADPVAQFNLGNTFALKGNLKAAVAQFRRVIQLKPDSLDAWRNLGKALALENNWAEEADCWRNLLKFAPNDVEAHCSLGYALALQGKFDEAIQHLREALRLQPDYSQAKEQLRALGVNVP
jgi:Flp pilus assembly protein TadD